MGKSEMLNKVIETYRCLLSYRKRMPGMSLEDAFSSSAVEDLEKEYEWLLSQKGSPICATLLGDQED
jgi:hypothetical protein